MAQRTSGGVYNRRKGALARLEAKVITVTNQKAEALKQIANKSIDTEYFENNIPIYDRNIARMKTEISTLKTRI